MMATENVAAVLRDLRTRVGGVATALVSRNGLVLLADLPEGVFSETYAVLCATIFGAAMTANHELNRAAPERIVVEGPDATTILVGTGESALLVTVVDSSADSVRVMSEMAKFVDLLSSLPGGPTP